jgi:hypothetical protein
MIAISQLRLGAASQCATSHVIEQDGDKQNQTAHQILKKGLDIQKIHRVLGDPENQDADDDA